MPLERLPLGPNELSAAAQRAVAAGPAKMMAARGLMPMSPADQAAVLYQLSLDSEHGVSEAARATCAGLPEKILLGVVSGRIDPRIVDFFVMLHLDKPAVLEAVILNAATADETVAALASRAGAREIDLIAQNEVRALRHPEIIGAMYLNPKARMSTVDRAVELAVRNGIRVPGVAAWDEVARALSGAPPQAPSPEVDAMFAVAASRLSGDDSALTNGDVEALSGGEIQELEALPPEVAQVQIDKLTVPSKIRLAMIGNAFARSVLIRDPLRIVALAAIKSERVTVFEAARYASNHSIGEDVIKYIAQKREWTKPYNVKLTLCMNPKAPVSEVARFLPHLRDRDLRNVSKSKGIPSAVAAQARKLLMQRSSPNK
ncbi:MAG: hypothetical protein R3B48_09230 [Kofleriaceae bacterium]